MSDFEGLVLRAGSNDDREPVTRLVFGVLEEYGLVSDHKGTDSDLQDIEGEYARRGGLFDVLETSAGEIVGTVGLYPLDGTTCELRKMYLHASVRGRGHGKRLLEHALAQARQRGFTRVVLETADTLREAVALYLKYGFKEYDPDHLSKRCDRAFYLVLE